MASLLVHWSRLTCLYHFFNIGGLYLPSTTSATAAATGAAVGVLSASNQDFSGDVLRVDASGAGAASAGAVLMRASAGGQDVFEVKVRSK